MPRRNNRHDAEVERIILGDDYKFTRDPEEAERRRKRRAERAKEARRKAQSAMRQEWAQCVVPDCRFQVPRKLGGGIEFPVCTLHAVAVWMDVEQRADEPQVQEATAALRARREAIAAEWQAEEEQAEQDYRQAFAAGLVDGSIYFIRANGLIKVGWSSDVESRLRAYGPNIEILCVYGGTRQDETTLHRQLKPSRAKGREWYHDDAIIQAFITEAVARHGKPMLEVLWRGPSEVVAGKRATRGR